jgi:methionyl-tRNA formyltransferase
MTMSGEGKEKNVPTWRVLYFGMLGTLSRLPLSCLLAAGIDVCGVVVPASVLSSFQLSQLDDSNTAIFPLPPSPTSFLLPADTIQLAEQFHLPVYAVRRLDDTNTLTTLAAHMPDMICVSCFSQRLPTAVLRLPRFGCLNLHPSWLPHFRGPAPLFWTFRRGEQETGVTVHFMDEGLDTGDITLQQRVSLADGISGAEAEKLMAGKGGELLLKAVKGLGRGSLPRHPQPAGYTADPWPTAADFALDANWSARRAFNFMRGTAEWKRPYPITIKGQTIWLQTAVAYDPDQTLPQPVDQQGDVVSVQFSPGVLRAYAPALAGQSAFC